MNEKQIKFRDAANMVERHSHRDAYGDHHADFEYVDANEHFDLVKLALELLADEPEKSLRDYTLAELAELVHDMAKEKGWWDAPREWPEIACLIHSEISEAVECYRRGEMALHVVDGKPEGFVVELADVVIRCLDYLHYLGCAREQMDSLTVAEAAKLSGRWATDMFLGLKRAHEVIAREGRIPNNVWAGIDAILDLVNKFNLDLPAAIEAKIEYNATRPYRHGGKKA